MGEDGRIGQREGRKHAGRGGSEGARLGTGVCWLLRQAQGKCF